MLALGVTTALSLSAFNNSLAATYKVVDKGDAKTLEYTYGKKQNSLGVMAVTGANIYNFPVQFEYLSESDFNAINNFSIINHDYVYGLEPVEDLDALKAGEPNANDLAWAKIYLKDKTKSSQSHYYKYQMVGDIVAMINLGEDSPSTEVRIFDTAFDGTYSADSILTRSTLDNIEGVSDSGIAFGTGTAPYLPMEEFTDVNGTIVQHWLRAHGQRGFFIQNDGVTVEEIEPIETRYGGGISAIFDMNDSGTAVGYTSYKLSEGREEDVLDPDNGCTEPNKFNIPFEICVQYHQSGMYHIQAFEAKISEAGVVEETNGLGLLITPHADDDRGFSSQALAVNNDGIAVGYSHGWDNTNVTAPVVNERMTGSYAVMFKEDAEGNKEVFDFNQKHYYFSYGSVYPFSKAHDINDSGLVVGYTRDVNTFVKKFFYVDTSVPESEMEIILPQDFFKTSVSTALAVNNSGVIVGEGEIETHNASSQNPRRTAGFMYDTLSDSPVIIDLNTLIGCSSGYNILKASDINNEGQISATAIVIADSYDAKGELIVDESGNPVTIDVVRAVLLQPIPDDGEAPCSETEDKVERQGASFGSVAILALFSLLGLRRRRYTH